MVVNQQQAASLLLLGYFAFKVEPAHIVLGRVQAMNKGTTVIHLLNDVTMTCAILELVHRPWKSVTMNHR